MITLATTLLLTVMSVIPSSVGNVRKDTLDFEKSSADSPALLVSGRISGLRTTPVDGSLNGRYLTFVRGLNSLRMESEPLWIVDGASLGSNATDFNSLAFLNPYDIESIQVVKDISDAAAFGSRGANGAIIITTRKKKTEGTSFEWHSNLGGSFPGVKGESFRNAFLHNHSFMLSSAKGQSSLNISGYLRNEDGTVRGTSNNCGGFRIAYETKANPVVWFGVNTILSMGEMSDQRIAAEYGQASLMMIQRFPESCPDESVSGYLKDYNNDATEMRMVTSADLTLNFTSSLSLKTTAGVDYRNFTGYEWLGKGTSEGLAKNGVARIAYDSSIRYTLNSTLAWNRHFGKNHVKAFAGAGIDGDWLRNDLMYGSDFFTHELRARGLNIHADKTTLDNCSTDYFNSSVFAGTEWDYSGRFGASILFKPSFTPRYGSDAICYYSISAFGKPLDILTLRAGYGKAGNEKYVPYTHFGKYLSFAYPQIEKDIQYFYEGLNRLSSTEFNAGADLYLPSGRLKVSAGYFRKHTEDAFLAFCFGAKSDGTLWNWAERSGFFDISSGLLSSGAELDASAVLVEKDNIHWSVNTSFSYSKTVLENLCTEDSASKDYFEDLIPRFYGGFGSTLQFGRFTIDALADFAGGYKTLNLSEMAVSPGTLPESHLQDAGYLRLHRISAGYTFGLAPGAFVKAIKLSLNAFNILTLSQYGGWNHSASNFGRDYGTYPDIRSIVAGASITF